MIQEKIKKLTKEALAKLEIESDEIILEHPVDLKMGDYSTNIAMVLAKNLKMNPLELAEKIVGILNEKLDVDIQKVEAVSGFINFYLSPEFFSHYVIEILENKNFGQNDFFIKDKENQNQKKKMMIEYTDPNPFKPFHIGHLMTNAIGESIARIAEYSGAEVVRANYQGDVGLHVARAIWGLQKQGLPDTNFSITEKANYIGECYTLGAKAYESEEAKKEIDEINKKVYDKTDKKINEIYDWGFKVTMEAFEDLYRMLGTKFDYYFLESQMAPLGEKIVRDNTGKIFEASDGAIVFKAEKLDPKLHTRVFITSGGLPTYETKELGLTEAKFDVREDLDLSIVITANEQADYMRVVAKAISIIHPEYEDKMMHIAHGMMRFGKSSLGKMSSREGNVITGESLLKDMCALIMEKISAKGGPAFSWKENEKQKLASSVAVAAIKYGILKQSTGGDIIFDFEQATSFEGDSGPYLQYSYARAKSVLEKAKVENMEARALPPENWEIVEVEKILYKFPEIVLRSAEEFEPHYIANYLIELARSYNSFYGNTKIIDKDNASSSYKIALTEAFSIIMKNGLHLLGIVAPEKM